MKKHKNVFTQLASFEEAIEHLEGKVLELEQRIEKLIQIERNHLVRIKNHEILSDDFIMQGKTYQDLSPEKALKLYQDPDFSFILLDVSSSEFRPHVTLPEAIKMPWEVFPERYLELQNRTIPILIICEDGTHSVLACEFLVQRGFYNCNNISGGYRYWKGQALKSVQERSA